jgi:hypothetical protein
MKNRKPERKSFFLPAAVIVVTALLISVVVFSAVREEPKQEQPKDWLSSIPPVMSKVKDLEIINVRLIRAGSDTPGVAFEIRNNSDRAVMAVNITCGEAGISKDGLEDEDNPTVIIEPHGTLKAVMYDELTRDAPLVISSATFADGTEEGSESSVKLMQRLRARDRAKHKAQREGQPAERRPNQ